MVGGPWRRIFAGFDDSKGNPSVIEWHRYCNGQWSMMTVKVMMTITMALAITMSDDDDDDNHGESDNDDDKHLPLAPP